MNEVAPATKPQVSLRLLAALTLVLALSVFLVRLWVIEPVNPAIKPKGLAALPFATLFAFGLSVVITLATANRHRWKAVLYPNRARIIGATVLALVTPVVVFSWVPWIIGGLVVVLGSFALSSETQRISTVLYGLVIFVAATALWYPVACLIVSGLQSRRMRVAVFSLMFWTAYSAVILILGTRIFSL